ncbi:MAG: amidohydrolase, partial [Candidatus Aminicenantes bacterium]|nr:amidohydrolase [Candidatus Aminicenantes bacterium]
MFTLTTFKKVPAIVLFFVMSVALQAVDKKPSQLIDLEIEKHRDEILKTRRFIHMNPELSNREFETSKLIAAKLMSLGLDVQTEIAKTGVVALLRGDQPGITVGCRADMDALPIQEQTNVPFKSLNLGVMHACGHDIHMSVALGTAMVMSALKDHIDGNIKFIFQPAEEGAPAGEEGGASLMIKEGVLDNPPVRAIFGLHVMPLELGKIEFSSGAIMASSDHFVITIKGESSHGANPHEGKDAITMAAQVIMSIQTIVSRNLDATDPAVISIGKIEGGVRSNIIADEVRLEGTVRTLSEMNRKKIQQLMEDLVKGITHSFGADYAFSYRRGSSPVYNHPQLAKVMIPTLHEVLG